LSFLPCTAQHKILVSQIYAVDHKFQYSLSARTWSILTCFALSPFCLQSRNRSVGIDKRLHAA